MNHDLQLLLAVLTAGEDDGQDRLTLDQVGVLACLVSDLGHEAAALAGQMQDCREPEGDPAR
jgi:hypothetical protein